jgi:hypothetical protein
MSKEQRKLEAEDNKKFKEGLEYFIDRLSPDQKDELLRAIYLNREELDRK